MPPENQPSNILPNAPGTPVAFPMNGNGNGSNPANQITGVKDPLSLSSLLGPKPVFSEKEDAQKQAKRAKLAKNLLIAAVFLGLAVYGFFYTRLTPDFTLLDDYFGPNPASRFESSNSELEAKKTELNLVRFRMARLHLDEVNSQIDAYSRQKDIINSGFSAKAQIAAAEIEKQKIVETIKKPLTQVQKILSVPIGVDTYTREPIPPEQREAKYENLLIERLNRERAALPGDAEADLVKTRLNENVVRLVQNKPFRKMLVSAALANMQEEEFENLLKRIREEGTDELATIDKIRRTRMDWDKVIQNIHAATIAVDQQYGKGHFKTIGGFLFSSYSFDSGSGRISISGITKQPDSRLFTYIARLIESVEKSPAFKDIDFRSFTKSKDEKGDYSSSLNLDFSLE